MSAIKEKFSLLIRQFILGGEYRPPADINQRAGLSGAGTQEGNPVTASKDVREAAHVQPAHLGRP